MYLQFEPEDILPEHEVKDSKLKFYQDAVSFPHPILNSFRGALNHCQGV